LDEIEGIFLFFAFKIFKQWGMIQQLIEFTSHRPDYHPVCMKDKKDA
jgi:hypothetical protein